LASFLSPRREVRMRPDDLQCCHRSREDTPRAGLRRSCHRVQAILIFFATGTRDGRWEGDTRCLGSCNGRHDFSCCSCARCVIMVSLLFHNRLRSDVSLICYPDSNPNPIYGKRRGVLSDTGDGRSGDISSRRGYLMHES